MWKWRRTWYAIALKLISHAKHFAFMFYDLVYLLWFVHIKITIRLIKLTQIRRLNKLYCSCMMLLQNVLDMYLSLPFHRLISPNTATIHNNTVVVHSYAVPVGIQAEHVFFMLLMKLSQIHHYNYKHNTIVNAVLRVSSIDSTNDYYKQSILNDTA